MKIALTYNLRLSDNPDEAEFDTAETVDSITQALERQGHTVEKIEVSGTVSHLMSRLEGGDPDLIFNLAEGRRGRAREALYPALFEDLGIPFTGSDAYVLLLTLDKWLTKNVLMSHGVDCPKGRIVTPPDLQRVLDQGCGVPFPVIVKPNFEGSSKGIADECVVKDPKQLTTVLKQMLADFPSGVLVEEFIAGTDVTVPFIEGVGDDGGILTPVEYAIESGARSKYNLYDYRLKNQDSEKVQVRCPPNLPRDVQARLRAISKTVHRVLALHDMGRIDYRINEEGRIYLLEVNALPSLEKGAGIYAAAEIEGVSLEGVIASIVRTASLRFKLALPEVIPSARKKAAPVRVGFTYNMKRVDPKSKEDEAEWDAPETIQAIADAIKAHGHTVVNLEATQDLPRVLGEADVDLIFNIAEGVLGRNREAQVPALCELLGIPYTGSDSATLAVALDKALAKKVLKQHRILTPEFQLFETGREKLNPALKFPVIVKPNTEGSSKGIAGSSVVDDEPKMRVLVKNLIEKYRQPALVEEYIGGREFTVGLLGDKRPRVLPPMEIVFRDGKNERPVYDYTVKQEWEKHVEYKCPAQLTAPELKAIERAARDTFEALDCRDVARVDLRMDKEGDVYVLEVNPLPGLTPNYSDLVLISQAAGIDYHTLIGEILAGGLKRLREKRRAENQEKAEKTEPKGPVSVAS
jgi:D-alanine-D-alanine ligase